MSGLVSGRLPDGVAVEGAVHLRVPLRRPLVTAAGTIAAHDAWLVRLRASDGRTGVGETTLGPGAEPGAVAALAAAVRAVVGGAGAAGAEGLPDATPEGTVGRALAAALDGALLDLGLLPSLASRASSIAVNALVGGDGPAAVAEAAGAAVAAGFGTVKLKAADDVVAVVAAVRERVGPGPHLRLDANGSWPSERALALLAAVAPYGIEQIEQPIAPAEPAVHAAFRAASPVPVALDESVTSIDAARALLAAGAADRLVVKSSRVGGPLAALAIAREAHAAGIPAIVASLLESGVGIAAASVVAAALPGDPSLAHGLATADLLVDDLVTGVPILAAGRLDVPPGPGLGIAIDREAVRALALEVVGRWR